MLIHALVESVLMGKDEFVTIGFDTRGRPVELVWSQTGHEGIC